MLLKQLLLKGGLLMGLSVGAFAQQNCPCRQALDSLVSKIENEYPGFTEKVKGNTELYTMYKNAARLKADSAGAASCLNVLTDYTAFFKDEHIWLQSKGKVDPAPVSAGAPQDVKKELEARLLPGNIFYIKVSSFQYANVAPFKALVAQHQKSIEKARALIVDVRDNFGGTDDVYQPLLPYILTNPLRIMNVEFLSTPTLINGLRDYALRQIPKDSLEQIRQVEEGLQEYKDSLGKFVLYGNSKVTIDTIKLIRKSPAQVVILANRNVASAGENFLFSAKQSKKVKILGTPSMGVLDYASIREFRFGCDNYELYLPTYRSTRLPQYPIDNIGVQPDVYLDESVGDWLAFAIQYINQ